MLRTHPPLTRIGARYGCSSHEVDHTEQTSNIPGHEMIYTDLRWRRLCLKPSFLGRASTDPRNVLNDTPGSDTSRIDRILVSLLPSWGLVLVQPLLGLLGSQ